MISRSAERSGCKREALRPTSCATSRSAACPRRARSFGIAARSSRRSCRGGRTPLASPQSKRCSRPRAGTWTCCRLCRPWRIGESPSASLPHTRATPALLPSILRRAASTLRARASSISARCFRRASSRPSGTTGTDWRSSMPFRCAATTATAATASRAPCCCMRSSRWSSGWSTRRSSPPTATHGSTDAAAKCRVTRIACNAATRCRCWSTMRLHSTARVLGRC